MTEHASELALRGRAEAAASALPALILSAQRLAAMVAPGAHGLRRAGPGEDFWQYRTAHSGDTARSIDWRRSARSDAQFVRDREAQTAQSAALWLSCGQSMGYAGAGRAAKLDRGRLLALGLAMLLLRGGEKVALGADPPRRGRAQIEGLASALLAARPAAGDDDAPDPAMLRPARRIVLISDFLGDPAPVLGVIAQAAQMGVTGAALQVLDPDEENFPFAGAALFTSASGALRHDTRDAAGLRDAYLARLAERRDQMRAACAAAGWHFGTHDTAAPPAQALIWLHQVLGG